LQKDATTMLQLLPKIPLTTATVRSHCPDCNGALAVLRVIPGRAKSDSRSEYWTMRCTRCGGIHLDILQAPPLPQPVQVSEECPA
jgi:uncharacterized Zn finger protein